MDEKDFIVCTKFIYRELCWSYSPTLNNLLNQRYIFTTMLKQISRVGSGMLKKCGPQSRRMSASLEGYGQHLFKGAVAAPYLEKAGLPKNALDSPAWTTNGQADKVASAVLEWAKVRH